MKTNALFSNKSFPAIRSAPERTVPALEQEKEEEENNKKKHTTEGWRGRNTAGWTQAEEDLLQ